MGLTNAQINFLSDEFGLSESQFSSLSPILLWKLREDCIEIECDEAEINVNTSTVRGNLAAGMVDLASSILPTEWKRLSPPEVKAMYSNLMATDGNFHDERAAVAV